MSGLFHSIRFFLGSLLGFPAHPAGPTYPLLDHARGWPAGPTSLMPAPSEWLWCVMVLGGFLTPPALHGSWQKGCFFPAVGTVASAQQWWKWMLSHQLVLWGSLKRSSWGFLALQTEPPDFCVFP